MLSHGVILAALLIAGGAHAADDYLEISGQRVSIGMTQAEVRSQFPKFSCIELPEDSQIGDTKCYAGDGKPLDYDGSISFRDGAVSRVTRYWHLNADANAYETLSLFNRILGQITGDHSQCTKVETFRNPERKIGDDGVVQLASQTTMMVLPRRILEIQTQDLRGGSVAIRETLRTRSVSEEFRVVGPRMRGRDWCAFVD